MNGVLNRPPQRILIASANPLFSKGLRKLFSERWPTNGPEMLLSSSMDETLRVLKSWQPELVVVDYDDHTIHRAEFLNHFVEGDTPMQVMLVSLQASGEMTVYNRRTLTPDQARDWLSYGKAEEQGNEGDTQPAEGKSKFFTRRWMITTLLVVVAIAAFIRLGIWQLDRLAERRALNARIRAVAAAPTLDLNTELPAGGWNEQEYRSASVRGVFEPGQEVILQNQVWEGQLGARVLTPLQIDGSKEVIVVDRGWIPLDQSAPAERAQYGVTGPVEVKGLLRMAKERPTFVAPSPTLAPGQNHLDALTFIDLSTIQKQTGQQMLPVILIEAPDPTQSGLPYRSQPAPDLTEGPHLGYALQWFLFALTLGLGYPYFVRRQLQRPNGVNKVATRTDGESVPMEGHKYGN